MWESLYYDENNKGSYKKEILWAEEHQLLDGRRIAEQIRLMKIIDSEYRKEDNDDYTFAIVVFGKKSNRVAISNLEDFPDIIGKTTGAYSTEINSFKTDNLDSAMQWMEFIREHTSL